MKKLLSLMVPALLLALLLAFAGSGIPSAHAAVTCSSSPSFQNCDNVYPESDICPADAITIASKYIVSGGITIGEVLVRYSPTCKSAWGKLDSNIPASLYLQLYRNGVYFSGASGPSATSIRTVMAYAAFQAMRACGSINGGTLFCTA